MNNTQSHPIFKPIWVFIFKSFSFCLHEVIVKRLNHKTAVSLFAGTSHLGLDFSVFIQLSMYP